jgi:hypothetical protein
VVSSTVYFPITSIKISCYFRRDGGTTLHGHGDLGLKSSTLTSIQILRLPGYAETIVDETRPICLRCKKRGLDCDGSRGLVWIEQSNTHTTTSPPVSAITKTHLAIELSLAAFEEDLCLAYTRKNLLRGGPVEVACNKIGFQENAPIFMRFPALSLLRKAIVSLSVTFYGIQHHDTRIISKGYDQYGEVLRRLNTTLTIPEQQSTNETLLTALTCMLLEVFMPTGPQNFLKHQRGIETIMCLRGPPTESTGETATIFHGLRIVSIISALVESRPSLYADGAWKHAPMAATTENGVLQHRIFTILATCTQLMSDRDALIASGTNSKHRELLLVRIDSITSELHGLYHEWERINKSELSEVESLSTLAKELGIANHLTATAYMLYYTTLICAIQIRDSLDPSPLNVELRNEAAVKIARCMELKEYGRREGFAESNTIWFVATRIAWQALGGFDTPQGRKLAQVVESSANSVYDLPGSGPLR